MLRVKLRHFNHFFPLNKPATFVFGKPKGINLVSLNSKIDLQIFEVNRLLHADANARAELNSIDRFLPN